MRDCVLQRVLVEQVAAAVRRLVVLVGVVAEVLLALGEHDAVDLRLGVGAGEGDALVHLRQPGAEGADGPLQLGLACRRSPSGGRSARSGRSSSGGSRSGASRRLADDDLDRPVVQALDSAAAAGSSEAVSIRSVASAPSSSTTIVFENVAGPLRRRGREIACSGFSTRTPFGTCSTTPPVQQASLSIAKRS